MKIDNTYKEIKKSLSQSKETEKQQQQKENALKICS